MKIGKSLFLLLTVSITTATSQAENIHFANNSVKALCIANWDTNNDQELSTEEAAAVTTLGTVFRDFSTTTTFHELRYFTGLTSIGERAFYNSSITGITIPEGVVEIGLYAFCKSKIAGELIIPSTVKRVRAYAFLECAALTRVILEEGVEEIGSEAFNGPIHFFSLPTTISTYGWDGVNPYMSHGFEDRDYEFHLFARSTTPLAVNTYAFHCLYGEGILVVPWGCIDAYKTTSPWNVFGTILEVGNVDENETLDDSDLAAIESYIAGGSPSPFNADLADINGDSQVDETDVQLLRNHLHPILLGDTNGDGMVNVQDQINLITHLLGKTTEVFIEEAADVNGDGVLNTQDAIGIIEIMLSE